MKATGVTLLEGRTYEFRPFPRSAARTEAIHYYVIAVLGTCVKVSEAVLCLKQCLAKPCGCTGGEPCDGTAPASVTVVVPQMTRQDAVKYVPRAVSLHSPCP